MTTLPVTAYAERIAEIRRLTVRAGCTPRSDAEILHSALEYGLTCERKMLEVLAEMFEPTSATIIDLIREAQ